MRPPFEVWAPRQIARLRSEADALQRTLESYLASADTQSEDYDPPVDASAPTPARSANGREGGRPVKHNRLLEFIDEAGPVGMTTDEVVAAAKAAGHVINRNSL